jgi:Metallo-peptidase family M12B Reprolysin-like
MRKRVAAIAATSVLSLGVASAPASAAPIEIGHIPECLELVPAAISLDSTPTTVDVRVLLDGVSTSRGQAVFQTSQRSYGPESITLNPSFQSVSFSGTDAEGLIEQAKALFGGARPAGTDVVYVLTNKDIAAIGSDAVAGLADCIGGVAFPAHAFAVGENFTPDEGALLGLPSLVNRNLTGKVASHEIGHLMGGHHHYANCIQGLLSDLGQEFSPCTLMFNDVGLAGLDFSIVNSLVVRGHAQLYARP